MNIFKWKYRWFFRTLFIIAIVSVFIYFGYDCIKCNTWDQSNKGKKALLHGVDTCIVESEQVGKFINNDESQIEVQYRDKTGVWHTEKFRKSAIKIIE